MLCLRNKEKVQEELTKALEVLIENDVDMILVEYFFYIQEMEWAIELCRKVKIRSKGNFQEKTLNIVIQYNKPIAATMAIGPKGDRSGISAGECAVRLVPNFQISVFQRISKKLRMRPNDNFLGWQRRAQTSLEPTVCLTLGLVSRR